MFDVCIMNPEHPDYEWFMHRGKTCGLIIDEKNYAVYLCYAEATNEQIELYNPARGTTYFAYVYDDVVDALSHETLHMIIRRLCGKDASHKLDNLLCLVPEEYQYAGF
jgi:hypothetical protein